MGDVGSKREYRAIKANQLYYLCQPYMSIKIEVDSNEGKKALLAIASRGSRPTPGPLLSQCLRQIG